MNTNRRTPYRAPSASGRTQHNQHGGSGDLYAHNGDGGFTVNHNNTYKGRRGIAGPIVHPAQRRILRQDKIVAAGAEQVGGQRLRLSQRAIECDQRKAWQKRA